jgi:DNA-binding beta-propeller fold protein YncE
MAGRVFVGMSTVVLAALVSACAASGPPRAPSRGPTAARSSFSRIDGPAGEFDSPDAVAVAGGLVWVANAGGNSVTEINANTGALIRVISASRYELNEPRAIAVTGTTVWVLNSGDVSRTAITEIDAATGALIRVISATRYHINGADGIAASGNTVWVANVGNGGGNSVTEINAATGALIRVLTGRRYQFSGLGAIAASGNTAWVADADSVTEIDATTGALIRVLAGGRYRLRRLQEIAVTGSTVWTAASPFGDGAVSTPTTLLLATGINAATGAPVRAGSATLPQFIFGMAADRFGAWLLINDVVGKAGGDPDGEVAEFSATTGALIRTLSPPIVKDTPGDGSGIAADEDHIWVTGPDYLVEFNAATGALIREIIAART